MEAIWGAFAGGIIASPVMIAVVAIAVLAYRKAREKWG